MKSSKKKLSPDDAELRKSVKPVICYPTDSLKSPNMNDYLIARKNLKKIDFCLSIGDIFKSDKQLLNYNLLNHF